MKKILLTSAGFENNRIRQAFFTFLERPAEQIRAIFVPTAAIDPEAVAMLPKCMEDLLGSGILPGNILVWDLHRPLSEEELLSFHTVYFCGGDPRHLLDRVNEIALGKALEGFLEKGGVYVGVSAGSVIATRNLVGSLDYINCTLEVHCDHGSPAGPLETAGCPQVRLTNRQAILIDREGCRIIE